ncbi:MAG: Fe-S cluster assembly protein SufD [Bacteroidota bacterium]|nr:Fe-S cluster assembly protein SufD [Bacteroidota bacterium]MDP4250752.1 Fe-S cluster assembly protein SufD [Bacteroidota bacterium]
MNSIEYFKERFEQWQPDAGHNGFGAIRQEAFNAFSKLGIPTSKNEEWKYTRVAGLFNKDYQFTPDPQPASVTAADVNRLRLPGYEEANELVFVNGFFSFALSVIRSSDLTVLALEEAAKNDFRELVAKQFGDSNKYIKDGIHALNTAFVHGGVFVHIKKDQVLEHPVYVYNITDARSANILAQPRSLIHINENAQVQLVETYITLGANQSFTNQVMEVTVEKDARLEYYKIQNDGDHTNQVSTTHIRQTGKSNVHTVTVSLNGGLVRNNLNLILDAKFCEAHLYGLYFQTGNSHIDNHTIVDNIKPNCLSNELYKGIMSDQSTGVFNGKIFVRPQAQKTNAYQSNKNVLLSDTTSVNAKPQLEIFADDVKCTHGCTVGKLNEEGLFYLQSRGIPEKTARTLLLRAYSADILEHIKPAPIRSYVERLIFERLESDIS